MFSCPKMVSDIILSEFQINIKIPAIMVRFGILDFCFTAFCFCVLMILTFGRAKNLKYVNNRGEVQTYFKEIFHVTGRSWYPHGRHVSVKRAFRRGCCIFF